MTPHTYDEATAVEFFVEETGEVQNVVMYDEPIRVSGQLDKRQEIADPTRPGTEAGATTDEGGANRAEVSVSDDGSYEYSVDVRSTSTTWVDEFTVTDELEAAQDGLARLTGIVTPVAGEDYDGLLNVWYRTDLTPADHVDGSGANATLSDGHPGRQGKILRAGQQIGHGKGFGPSVGPQNGCFCLEDRRFPGRIRGKLRRFCGRRGGFRHACQKCRSGQRGNLQPDSSAQTQSSCQNGGDGFGVHGILLRNLHGLAIWAVLKVCSPSAGKPARSADFSSLVSSLYCRGWGKAT